MTELREKIGDLLFKASSNLGWAYCHNLAESILDLIKQEGYMHKDDPAEGWVVREKAKCKLLPDNCIFPASLSCSVECEIKYKSYVTRPATIQEVLAKKAVRA